MFILYIGGVGPDTGPGARRIKEEAINQQGLGNNEKDNVSRNNDLFVSTQKVTLEGQVVPITLQEGISMVSLGKKQVEYYKPINNVLGPLLGAVDAINLGVKSEEAAKRDELKAAWNNVQNLAKAGNKVPLEFLSKAGIQKVVNNPEKLTTDEQKKLKVVYAMTKEFQSDWQNTHDIGIKVLEREKELTKLLREAGQLAKPQ